MNPPLTPEQTNRLNEEFVSKLNAFLLKVRDRATEQFKYNLETYIPKGWVKVEDVVENAINSGIVSGVASMNHWDIAPTVKLASSLLEDVNAHSENKAMLEQAKKNGIDV